MVETIIKGLHQGGAAALAFFSLIANVFQWRDRQKIQNDLLVVNKEQHAAQINSIKILTEIKTKVDKCDK